MYAYRRAAAASLGGPWASGRSVGDLPAQPRCGSLVAGRPADDSQKLAVTLIRGVAAVPAGRERSKVCTARRARIVCGIELALQVLEAMEEALRSPSVLRAGPDGEPSPELLRHLEGLGCAASTTRALETAARTLRTLDSCDTPELAYSEIAAQLCIIKDTLRDFTGMMLDAGSTAARQPKQAGRPAALRAPSAEKREALSDACSCSTASGSRSGYASEVSSEADCDSPRRCASSDEEAFAAECGRASAEGARGRRPCGAYGLSWYTTPLYWG
mmetsp:Transcript_37240/g.104559  ORF Transcript_37240/g.104559 Transcript_37240/m.104559 type:complete len:273 (-) Transcript_37240:31-849(-)